MSRNPHFVDFEDLCQMSGLSQAAAVRRWASEQGIATKDGAKGPWTTIEAINAALGVRSSNDPQYRPEQVL